MRKYKYALMALLAALLLALNIIPTTAQNSANCNDFTVWSGVAQNLGLTLDKSDTNLFVIKDGLTVETIPSGGSETSVCMNPENLFRLVNALAENSPLNQNEAPEATIEASNPVILEQHASDGVVLSEGMTLQITNCNDQTLVYTAHFVPSNPTRDDQQKFPESHFVWVISSGEIWFAVANGGPRKPFKWSATMVEGLPQATLKPLGNC